MEEKTVISLISLFRLNLCRKQMKCLVQMVICEKSPDAASDQNLFFWNKSHIYNIITSQYFTTPLFRVSIHFQSSGKTMFSGVLFTIISKSKDSKQKKKRLRGFYKPWTVFRAHLYKQVSK